MLDLQRHSQCPIWEAGIKLATNTDLNENSNKKSDKKDACDGVAIPWPGLEYACLKIFQTYCKIFNQEEIYDLIVSSYLTNNNLLLAGIRMFIESMSNVKMAVNGMKFANNVQ
uniref:CSON005596 protein n=1 Tax=Culicoides sonorensis TaxID=179676 RepID=A0A336MQU3_CULSO